MMGLFTLYTGFLYNVFFSKSIVLVQPYWKNTYEQQEVEGSEYITLNPVFETNPPYIFGVDPIWAVIKIIVSTCYKTVWLHIFLLNVNWHC